MDRPFFFLTEAVCIYSQEATSGDTDAGWHVYQKNMQPLISISGIASLAFFCKTKGLQK
jgi:hypothetical protein